MIENFEMQFTASLLNDPKQINDIDVNPDWFINDSFKEIVIAIQSKKGEQELLNDILTTIKQLSPFNKISIDDLILLRDSEPTSAMTEFYAIQIHKVFVKNELKRLTDNYSDSEDERLLQQITDYQEELLGLNKRKMDGSIRGYDRFVEHLKAEKNEFIQTFKPLDTSLGGGFGPGELVVVGARPAVGKTAFAINLALQSLAKNEEIATDIFTLEMTQEQMMYRFVSNKAKVNNMQIRNPKGLDRSKKNLAAKAYQEISEMNLKIYDQEYTQLNDIITAIKKRAEKGKYLAIIDYVGLVAVSDSRKDQRQIISEVTRRLKLLTNELQITIILLAQLNRETEKTGKVPTLADLKDSGSLEQDANIVMFLYRPDEENRQAIKVKIAKSRDGVIGELPFKFIGQFMDFSPEVQYG
jgi:replicative DNA helicase